MPVVSMSQVIWASLFLKNSSNNMILRIIPKTRIGLLPTLKKCRISFWLTSTRLSLWKRKTTMRWTATIPSSHPKTFSKSTRIFRNLKRNINQNSTEWLGRMSRTHCRFMTVKQKSSTMFSPPWKLMMLFLNMTAPVLSQRTVWTMSGTVRSSTNSLWKKPLSLKITAAFLVSVMNC